MFHSFIMFQGLFFFNYTFLISNIFSNELSDIYLTLNVHCVKLGDVLSPTLFSIFINGIVNDFENGICDSVQVNNLNINCILYADDIVIFFRKQKLFTSQS